MSKIKTKSPLAKVRINRFSGIRQDLLFGETGASDIQNYRILSDGTAEKRCGWSIRHTLSGGTIRGVWKGRLNGVDCSFAVAGNTVYRIVNNQASAIATLTTEEGLVTFFVLSKYLYLLDGMQIMTYREESRTFTKARGYVPLYGREWNVTDQGLIYEPINLLNHCLRVHFVNPTHERIVRLPFTIREVESVWYPMWRTARFTYTPGNNYIELLNPEDADELEISYTFNTLPDEEETYDLRKLNRAAGWVRDGAEAAVLYGEAEPQTVFIATPVADYQDMGQKVTVSESDVLYINYRGVQVAGSSAYPVKTVCSYRNRLLVFTENAISGILRSDSANFLALYPLKDDIGCTSARGAISYGDTALFLNRNGIFRIRSQKNNPDDLLIDCISEPVRNIFTDGLPENGILYRNDISGEVWVRNPEETESDGNIWIRKDETGDWYRYTNILAEVFYPDGGNVGFAYQNHLCAFVPGQYRDNGREIYAVYQSHYLSFDQPALKKRVARMTVGVKSPAAMTLTIWGERAVRAFPIPPGVADNPTITDRRIGIGRFRLLRFRLVSYAPNPAKIHFVELVAGY